MPWQDDPYGLLRRLFWNEHAEDPDEGVFRVLGIVHLYAASGIHLYAFLQTLDAVAFPVARRFSIDLRWTKRVAIAAGLALLGWAWALQGFRPGFARPLVTFFVRRWGAQHGARFRLLAPLAVTLALDLLLDFGGGRGHYYLAITGGLLAMEWLERRRGTAGPFADERPAGPPPGVFVTHIALSIGSWILTAPLDLVLHHRIAWMTPVYSLLTLPVLSQLLYPASLLSLAIEGQIVHPLMVGWRATMSALVWIADHTPGPVHVTSAAIVASLLFTGAAVVIRSRARGWRLRARIAAASVLLSGAAVARPFLPATDAITQLSVGQGDALLVQLGGRRELVDAGPERGLRGSGWIEELGARDIPRIDTILLTHLDADHVHGLTHLLPWVEVGCIETHPRHWASEKGLHLAAFLRQRFPAIRHGTGECFRSGEVAWFGSEKTAGGNSWMAGVVIPLGPDRAYFAVGDGDQSQERQFRARFARRIAATPHRIWKLSHHGSRYSSDPDVLRSIGAEELWVSVGRRNPYHHPSPETLRRVQALGGVKLYRTDVDGALTAKTSQPSRETTFE